MSGQLKSCSVKGGMIRVTCTRCSKTKYAEVTPGIRRKVVRCSCGMSGTYKVNYRRDIRENSSSRAQVVLNNSREAPIRLCDTSTSGVGFTIPREIAHSLYRGQEIRIKYKGGSGALAQRRIRIRNITGTRIGGQYS